MNKPFFSIIIPIYKTEAFLEQCIRSVLNQSFVDFECIVVNDGSIGVDSKEFEVLQDPNYKANIDISKVEYLKQVDFIFQELVGQDPRFKLINKSNGGLSDARNTALEHVNGKWLLLIDSDDWIKPRHFENFHNLITQYNGPKIIIPRLIYTENYNTGNKLNIYVPRVTTLANSIHSCTFISTSYAINLEIVAKYKLRYDPRLGRGSNPATRVSNGGEDFLFAYQYIDALEKENGLNSFEVVDLEEQTYMYRELEAAKKSAEDNVGPYNYARYFQQFGYLNPRFNIKIITFLLPFWAKLRFYKNTPATILRKGISLFLRWIS